MLGACSGASAPAATPGPKGAAAATQQASVPAAAGPASAAAGGTDPCSVLTQAEVDTAVGQALGPGTPDRLPGECLWNAADFSAGVTVTIGDWDSVKTAAASGSTVPTSIPGVGDEALYLNGTNLYVRKGSTGFLLVMFSPHIDPLPDHGLAREKVLAAAILGRM